MTWLPVQSQARPSPRMYESRAKTDPFLAHSAALAVALVGGQLFSVTVDAPAAAEPATLSTALVSGVLLDSVVNTSASSQSGAQGVALSSGQVVTVVIDAGPSRVGVFIVLRWLAVHWSDSFYANLNSFTKRSGSLYH